MNDWSNGRQGARGFRFGSRSRFGTSAVRWRHMAKIIELFPEIVSSRPGDETILVRDETISCLGADITKRRATPALRTGDSQMRTFSFILAFAFVLAPSVAGLSDSLPGIGTFAYNGSPVTSPPQALV